MSVSALHEKLDHVSALHDKMAEDGAVFRRSVETRLDKQDNMLLSALHQDNIAAVSGGGATGGESPRPPPGADCYYAHTRHAASSCATILTSSNDEGLNKVCYLAE